MITGITERIEMRDSPGAPNRIPATALLFANRIFIEVRRD
jgi:hypothetical protein